jgi:hypothetical protein
MSTQLTTEPWKDPSAETAPERIEGDEARHTRTFENWLETHLNALALVAIAAGLGIRIYVAGRSYLNPDEALHFLLINQRSLWSAYQASLTNAHPPLIYVLLYFWRFLGRSELMLRLPSVLAGAATCWFAFKWIGNIFGKAAGAIALILFTFSPAMIALSAEVRAYALLLFCIVAALYFLDRAFHDFSVRHLWYFSLFLCAAILSHYSALFFTLAVGFYSLLKIAEAGPPRKFVAAWAGGQALAFAIYVFLYLTHVSKIQKNEMSLWASPFDGSFFHLGQQSLLTFTREHTYAIFVFLFEQDYISEAMFWLFLVGLTLLFFRDWTSGHDRAGARRMGILLLIPFIAVWAAAVAGIYPYAGTRHTVFLDPFIIAGISCGLANIFRRQLWALLIVASLLMVGSNTSGKTSEPFIRKENQRRDLMTEAITHIQRTIPRGDPIFVDLQSSFLISYYLCAPADTIQIEGFRREFYKFGCGGYSVISTNDRAWKLNPDNFAFQFQRMAVAYGLHPGDRVWVYQAGWGANLDTELSWQVMKFRCMTPASFGDNITVIPFVTEPDLSPALPPGSPHLTQLGRCAN